MTLGLGNFSSISEVKEFSSHIDVVFRHETRLANSMVDALANKVKGR